MAPKKQVSIRLTDDEHRLLTLLADRDSRTVPGLVLHYVKRNVDRARCEDPEHRPDCIKGCPFPL